MAGRTLVEVLRAWAREHPERCAYTFLADGGAEASSWSYGELDARARAVGRLLESAGARGERALLLYPPGLDFVAGFFGALYGGAVAVPVQPPGVHRGLGRLRRLVEDARPAVVLTTTALLEKLGGHLSRDPVLGRLVCLATEAPPAGLEEEWRDPGSAPAATAFLQYTSGSTSDPKGVMVGHGNLVHNLELIREACRHSAASTFVSWLPPYHDMGLIGNLLQSAYVGARCVLMAPVAFLQAPRRWLEAVSRFGATTSGGPNFAYELCARKVSPEEIAGLDLSRWEVAFNGAEPVRRETLDRFAAAFAPAGFRREAFYPCYGLAEATLMVSGGAPLAPVLTAAFDRDELERGRAVPATGGDAAAARGLVGCGGVLGGQRLEVVDPETLARCRPGEIGEIWLAGPSVGQGYWNRPEQTAQDFGACLAGTGDGPFLRTGDLGFLHRDQLFVAGRLKDLIILRGRNLYPQDIELTAERSHPALRLGCATAFPVEAAGKERLVVAVEVERHHPADLEPVAEAVRQAVAQEHEAHITEVVLLRAGTLPKTTSGKVQRRACRALYLAGELAAVGGNRVEEEAAWTGPGFDRDALLALPESERLAALSARLAERVARAAGVARQRIDPALPLSALGLDSLAAIELRGELEAELGVSLAAADLLEAPSLAGLAGQVLAGLAAAVAPAPGPAPVEEGEHPLSWIQQSLWLLQERHPQSTAYNVALAVRLGPVVEVEPLRAALELLAGRHPMLRATFRSRDGVPLQRDGDGAAIAFAQVEAAAWEETELERRLAAAAHQPFDLAAGPVARATLFRGAAGGDLLLFAAHHLVIDGWSLWVLLDELAAVYGALRRGEAPALPPLPFRYADFVRGQEELLAGPAGDGLWRFWREELAGELPPLELPIDRARTPLPLPPCGRAAFTTGAELTRRLREVARGQGATLQALLLAAYEVLLHRYSGQPRFVIGALAAGRGRPELAGVVGCFFNPLPVVADLAGDPGFLAVLAAARRRTLAALAHQDYPAHVLAQRLQTERGASRLSLFDVTFIFQRPHRPAAVAPTPDGRGLCVEASGLALELYPVERRFARSDLELEVTDAGAGLLVALHYRSDLFAAATVEAMAAAFEILLGAVAADPARPVSELPVLPAAEERRLLAEWSGSGRRYPADGTVHALIAERAARRPERTAAAGNGRELSYAELERESERLARRLAALDGIGGAAAARDRLVGLMVDHDHALPVGLLGIWKAGCGFVPIDAAWPTERIALIAEECRLAALVTEGRHLARAAEVAARVAPRRLVCLDALGAGPEAAPARAADPDELAYVIYTSGSTGRPKGVALAHRHLVPVLLWGLEALRLGEHSRVLQTLSYWFDFGVFEVLTTLLAGGTLVFQDRAGRGEPRRWAEQVRRDAIDTVHTTPAFFREVAALGEPLPGLAVLHLGGEELTTALVAAARPLVGAGCAIFNGYGPTETAVNSSLFEIDGDGEAGAGSFPIGRPSANNRLYVLDRRLRPLPAGAPGELYVGGDGVARGYLARPDLTAERFLPDPFAGAPGARFYRTGDLARFRPDGNLEFLGRADDQIKVRGFRIELAEVEAALGRCPGVREAVVVAQGDGAAEKRLVAYVVGREGQVPAAAELRRRLGASLPDYLVPSAYVTLERLPRNANGKLDRRALPPPRPAEEGDGEVWVTPRGPVEEVVAGICAELLERPRVGAEESLLDLGCHSLLATRIVARLGEAFAIDLPLAAFFEAPSVAGLAAAVEAARAAGGGGALPPIARVPRDRPLPLSFAQERIWFLHQLEPRSVAYNIPRALRIEGPLAPRLVVLAFTEIFRRHEILRTTFPAVEGVPVQVVHPARPAGLPVVDLAALPAGRRETCAQRLIVEHGQHPFDLENGPLMRLLLLRNAAEDHILVLSEHHLVHDGWTQGVLVGEFLELYRAFAAGRPSPLPEMPIQYGDFAAWQRRSLEGEALAPLLAYWRAQLAGLPPVLELPANRPRPAVQSFRGGLREAVLEGEAAESVRRFGRRRGATLFMSTLAAFAALLARLSGQELFAIGTGVANRQRPELEGLLGMIINTLVLRGDVSGGPTFGELLRRTREVCLGAYEHQDLPFEKLVEALRPERTLRHMPLFQVMYAFLDTPMEALELPGLTLSLVASHNRSAKFDLNLTVVAHSDQRSGGARHLTLMLEYATDLFDGTTAERLLRQFRTLLESAVAEPEAPVSRLPLLGGAERQQLLREWNDTAAAYPRERPVHELFAEQARRRPEAPAVVCGEESLSYGELERRANRLVNHLRRLGVGPETVVALALERSSALVVAMLAVLKAGGAYAPLDPSSPAERLGWMLEDLGAAVMLTEEALAGALPETAARVMVLEREAERIAAESVVAPEVATAPESLAYVIFTSGSTGRPKGVEVTHGGLGNLVAWHRRVYDVTSVDRATLLASPAFDASVWEVWPYLTAGASLHIPDAGTRASAERLTAWLTGAGATLCFLPTPLAELALALPAPAGLALRALLTGGDRLRRVPPPGLPYRLVNHYGPTENSVVSTAGEVPAAPAGAGPAPAAPAIGRAIANTRLFVLDRDGSPVPPEVPGELFVGGPGLARGYRGRPDLTAERFGPDPWSGDRGARLYRTGDLVRFRADGELEFLGRTDHQVKLRGFRVELGEVEAALARCPGVREAVVVALGDGADKRLVAYVVPGGQVSELRRWLAASLPEYMVPSAFVSLERLPRTAAGKVDRRALPAPDRAAPEDGFVAPRTEVERLLAGICGELLGVEEVGVRDNFFHLGGHSLHVTRLLSRIRRELDVELPVSEFFKHPTVEGLALAAAAGLAADLDGDELSRLVAEVELGEAGTSLLAGGEASG